MCKNKLEISELQSMHLVTHSQPIDGETHMKQGGFEEGKENSAINLVKSSQVIEVEILIRNRKMKLCCTLGSKHQLRFDSDINTNNSFHKYQSWF